MYMTLDHDLRFDESGGLVRNALPALRLQGDYWYFGIRILFGDHGGAFAHQGYRNEIKMLLGVKQHDDGTFTVRSDKEMIIRPENSEHLAAFCQAEYESMKEFLSTPVTGPKKQIGFVPPSDSR